MRACGMGVCGGGGDMSMNSSWIMYIGTIIQC